jgi:hypothetical protein
MCIYKNVCGVDGPGQKEKARGNKRKRKEKKWRQGDEEQR